MSNPVIYYLKWVVSETVGGFNAGKIKSNNQCSLIVTYVLLAYRVIFVLLVLEITFVLLALEITFVFMASLFLWLQDLTQIVRSDERRLH